MLLASIWHTPLKVRFKILAELHPTTLGVNQFLCSLLKVVG